MADTVKIVCDVDGYEANYVEFNPRWTRADTKRLDTVDDDDFFDLLRAKLAGCHLEIYDADGDVIDTIESPDEMTEEALDELEEIVVGWLGGTLHTFIGNRRMLGRFSARVSSSTNGKAPPIPEATKAATPASTS